MSEARVFPEEYREFRMQSYLVVVAAMAILFTLTYGEYSLLAPGPSSLLMTPLIFVFVIIGVEYWQIRALRSKAMVVTPGKTLYEGRVYRRWHILIVLVSLFIVLTSMGGFLRPLMEGGLVGFAYLPWIIIWAELAVRTVIIMLRSTIRVEVDGLVLSESLLQTVPSRFIPFDGLDLVRLKRNTLRLAGKRTHVDEWMTVRDPGGLRPIVEKLERDGHLGDRAIPG